MPDHIELDRLGSETMFTQQFLALGQAVARRFVLMKEVTTEQYHVDLLLFGDNERFFEWDKRVIACYKKNKYNFNSQLYRSKKISIDWGHG